MGFIFKTGLLRRGLRANPLGRPGVTIRPALSAATALRVADGSRASGRLRAYVWPTTPTRGPLLRLRRQAASPAIACEDLALGSVFSLALRLKAAQGRGDADRPTPDGVSKPVDHLRQVTPRLAVGWEAGGSPRGEGRGIVLQHPAKASRLGFEDVALEEESLSPEYDDELVGAFGAVEDLEEGDVEEPEVTAEADIPIDLGPEVEDEAPVVEKEEVEEADEPVAAEPEAEEPMATEPVMDEATMDDEVSLDLEPEAETEPEYAEGVEEMEDEDIELLDDSEGEDEDYDSGRKGRKRRRRDRRLEYDERLGRVVSRKRHKNRARNWMDALDEDSWDEDF